MKISTKTGDNGETSLYNNKRVSKDNIQIEICGTLDEFNSSLGVALTKIRDQQNIDFLSNIQKLLFIIGAHFATNINERTKLPQLKEKDIKNLENSIELLENKLPIQKEFIIPQGSETASFLFFSRTICRRAERRIVSYLKDKKIDKNMKNILKFINRLSDYLFLLARFH